MLPRTALAQGLIALVVLASGCSISGTVGKPTDPRETEALRIVTVVSSAISWPRQDSADGYARAAQETRAGQDGRLRVIEASPRDNGGDLLKPIAHLVYLIELSVDASEFGGSLAETPNNSFCFGQDYDVYGTSGEPQRLPCPADPTDVTPPPAPPEVVIGSGADAVVERVLRSDPTAEQAAARVRAVLVRMAAKSDPVTAPPAVEAKAEGQVLALAVRGAPGHCLLGRRTGSKVEVWYLSRMEAMPGELGCTPEVALAAGR